MMEDGFHAFNKNTFLKIRDSNIPVHKTYIPRNTKLYIKNLLDSSLVIFHKKSGGSVYQWYKTSRPILNIVDLRIDQDFADLLLSSNNLSELLTESGANGWYDGVEVGLTFEAWINDTPKMKIFPSITLFDITYASSSRIRFSLKENDSESLTYYVCYGVPNVLDISHYPQKIRNWVRDENRLKDFGINGWIDTNEVEFSSKILLRDTKNMHGRFRRPFFFDEVIRIKEGWKISPNNKDIINELMEDDNRLIVRNIGEWYSLCWRLKVSSLAGVTSTLRYWSSLYVIELKVMGKTIILRGEKSVFVEEKKKENVKNYEVEGITGLKKIK